MIYDIWHTRIYVGKVRDHEKVKQAFLPYLEDPTFFSKSWALSHNCISTLNSDKNEELPWQVWFDAISPNLHEMIEQYAPRHPIMLDVMEQWANIYYKNGFQEIHEHIAEGRSFSCSYFIEKPQGEDVGGELIFDNAAMSLQRACDLPQTFHTMEDNLFIPSVSEGTLVVFPSWVKHFTNPNLSDERRSTISANFRIMNMELRSDDR